MNLVSALKRIIVGLMYALLLALPAHAEVSESVTLQATVGRRNAVVTDPQTGTKTWVHLKTGCGDLAVDQSVTVSVDGNLDGNGDTLKVNETQRCEIDRAEPITQVLKVPYFTSSYEIQVIDESGQSWFLRYGERCEALPQFRNSLIFVLQGGTVLAEGDRLILPDNLGDCSVVSVREPYVKTPPAPTDPLADRQAPTSASQLKAVPEDGAITLEWKAAEDNRGVASYWVSFSEGPLDPKGIAPGDMPNLVSSPNPYFKISGLTNGRLYHFYVLAVDTSGNLSSDWAQAQGMPSASVIKGNPLPQLHLQVEKTSALSATLVWERVSYATRHSVAVETDGRRTFFKARYPSTRYVLTKNPSTKKSKIRFTVTAYDRRGLVKQETLEFEL